MPTGPRDPFVSPRFGQLATFMLLPAAEGPAGLDVALLGLPYDGGVSYRPGARFGPRAVREQSSLIRPWNPVLKVHPFEKLRVADCGDVDVVPISIERTHAAIEAKIDTVIAAGARPLCVGGDHSVTLPIIRSLARRHGPLAVVHFDAHPDTWDQYFGEQALPRHAVPAGDRGRRDRSQAHDPGRHPRAALRLRGLRLPRRARARGAAHRADQGAGAGVGRSAGWRACAACRSICSFDIDAVDPAYAPATGTPEVGGLSSWEALSLVRSLAGLARWWARTSSRSRRRTTAPGRSPRCWPPTWPSRSSA